MRTGLPLYRGCKEEKMFPSITDFIEDWQQEESRITETRRKPDRTGHFYHVVTQSWTKEMIFYRDVAVYRDTLLGKLCTEKGIRILFSVCMPNHTHEVFMTRNWENLTEMLRVLNLNVSRYIHRHYPEKTKHGKRVFDHAPAYFAVKDIKYLFFLGKYIFDNPGYLEQEGRKAPSSCFWMFERDHFTAGYDRKLYQSLFGLSPTEILSIYSSKSKEEVRQFADNHFRNWTEDANRNLFVCT